MSRKHKPPYHPHRRKHRAFVLRAADENGVNVVVYVPETKVEMHKRSWPTVHSVEECPYPLPPEDERVMLNVLGSPYEDLRYHPPQ